MRPERGSLSGTSPAYAYVNAVDFEAEDNSPFAFKSVLVPAQCSWGDARQAVSKATQAMRQLCPAVVPQQALEFCAELCQPGPGCQGSE
eukprot:gene27467-4770_t